VLSIGLTTESIVASVEHRFDNGIEFRMEAYQKDYDDLRPRFENLLNTFIILPELKPDRVRIAPDGGTAKGLELTVRRPVSEDPLSWWLSYSWSPERYGGVGIRLIILAQVLRGRRTNGN
jgi:hypothetical protein